VVGRYGSVVAWRQLWITNTTGSSRHYLAPALAIGASRANADGLQSLPYQPDEAIRNTGTSVTKDIRLNDIMARFFAWPALESEAQ
jgi:hypothetical protein